MPLIFWRVFSIACMSALVVAGIDWGLPSPAADESLFGTHAPWDGRALAAFDAERIDPAVGADVDRDPLPREASVALNDTDAARAAIVRRYRLFSHQPDEMITFMALQQMRPGERQFDPRLYQYGGVWIYGVGGLLEGAAKLGLIDLRADKAFYYDHPDAFGRFYIVARAYTLAAYALLLLAVGMILKRLAGTEAAAAVGAAVVGGLPVVFALGHEAKPHVAGVAFVLLTALAGARWVRSGRLRDAAACGALAGLAAGTVLSAAVAACVPLTMVFLRRSTFDLGGRRDSPSLRLLALVVAGVAAVVVFAATNPYVVLHAVRRDAVLASNLANTKAMYGVGSPGVLLADGAAGLRDALSWPAAALAIGGFVVAVTRRRGMHPLAVLLAVPTALVLVQFFAFAAGKPAEYARFALLPAVVLGVLGVWSLSTITRSPLRATAYALAVLAVAIGATWPYVAAFAADTGENNTRAIAAAAVRRVTGTTLQVVAEPAPYAVPPVDLWAWQIRLTPVSAGYVGDVIVRAVDDPVALPAPPAGYRRELIDSGGRPAPITWANKPIEVLTRDGTGR